MNQADVTKLMSALKFKILPKHRRVRNPEGPPGRLDKLRKTVTALIKHERIELNHSRADEARGYAERLISDAIRNGDTHEHTMKMANFWIVEKQYIHKLFKVLAPRFQNYNVSYTRMYKAPQIYPNTNNYKRAVLELRGNPYPGLKPELSNNRKLIHNILLEEARKEYRKEKYAEFSEKLAPLSEANQSKSEEADVNVAAEKSSPVDSEEVENSNKEEEKVENSSEKAAATSKSDDGNKDK